MEINSMIKTCTDKANMFNSGMWNALKNGPWCVQYNKG